MSSIGDNGKYATVNTDYLYAMGTPGSGSSSLLNGSGTPVLSRQSYKVIVASINADATIQQQSGGISSSAVASTNQYTIGFDLMSAPPIITVTTKPGAVTPGTFASISSITATQCVITTWTATAGAVASAFNIHIVGACL